MRALPLLLTGCLASPTGLDQTWPREDTTVITAIAANLDDDGADEVVVAATGEFPGLFVFDDADYDFGAGNNVLPRFSAYHPYDVQNETALLEIDQLVYASTPTDAGLQIDQFDDQLALLHTNAIDAARPEGPYWMSIVPFAPPGMMDKVVVRAGDRIYHFAKETLEVDERGNEIPQDPAIDDGWRDARTATGFDGGMTDGPQALVITDTDVRRASIKEMFEEWTSSRSGGAPWIGQITARLDTQLMVIGYDTILSKLCAVDPTVADAVPVCIDDPIADVGNLRVFVSQIDGDNSVDLLAAIDTPDGLEVEVWKSIAFTPGVSFTGTRDAAEPGAPGPRRAIPVLVRRGTTRDVFLIEETGNTICDPSAPDCREML